MKRVAIVQSNYIPWKGYFDLIRSVDEFVLFDDVQYTRRDWRNRNRIKTPQGLTWLSIPVQTKGEYLALIKDIEVSDTTWGERHWKTIAAAYGKAPHFRWFADRFEPLYRDTREPRLSLINRRWLEAACQAMEIPTRLTWSMDYQVAAGKTERLAVSDAAAWAPPQRPGPGCRGRPWTPCPASAVPWHGSRSHRSRQSRTDGAERSRRGTAPLRPPDAGAGFGRKARPSPELGPGML